MALDSLLDAIERLPAFNRVLGTLPAPGQRLVAGGLPGSADAALVAALARRLPTRFFVIATEGVADAERWLADLGALLDDAPIALYPPREGFGEAEPHVEVAGERVETLERMTRGDVRILLTTARALLERTRMPSALRDLRIELRKGATYRLSALAAHLESIGFERVPMVEDVAQFSVRGGIFDVYSVSAWPSPSALEFWGDEIVDLRHFDLLDAAIQPHGGFRARAAGGWAVCATRPAISNARSIASLFPPDTILVAPRGSHFEPELRRTWERRAASHRPRAPTRRRRVQARGVVRVARA